MKQSSVVWLANKMMITVANYAIRKLNGEEFTELMHEHLQTAREMRRKEIEEAYRRGFNSGILATEKTQVKNAEQYYTETFKQNG